MNSQSGFGCQESFFTLELQFQADLSLLAADLSTFLTSWTSSINKKLEEIFGCNGCNGVVQWGRAKLRN